MIVVQGEVTEVEYFRRLREMWRIPNLQIVPIPESPETMVNSALSKIERDSRAPYDEVYFVVDVDDSSTRQFDEAFRLAKKLTSKSTSYWFVVSNESFDTWLLGHFEDIRKCNWGRKQIQERLKKGGHLIGSNGKSLSLSFPFVLIDTASEQVDLCDYNEMGKTCSTAVPHLVKRLAELRTIN